MSRYFFETGKKCNFHIYRIKRANFLGHSSKVHTFFLTGKKMAQKYQVTGKSIFYAYQYNEVASNRLYQEY